MAAILYLLCAGTALICAILLLRGYPRSRAPLLLWFGLFFVGLTLHNLLVFVDRIVLPSIDFSLPRVLVELVSVAVLLYGMIWKAK